MKSIRSAIFLSCAAALCFTGSWAVAGTPQFGGLSQGDVDSANREFIANSSWHSVTTPSSLGLIWGFELGVVGGITKTPDIDTLVKRVSPSTDVPMIPHAGLLGAVTLPFAISVEALYVPKVNQSGVDFQQYGGAVKWTPTDDLWVIPVNISVRGFLAKSNLSFAQTVTDANSGLSVPAKVQQTSQVTGLQIFASPKLIPILEPYIGLGLLSAKGNLNADVVNTTLFANNTVSPDTTATSTQLFVGLEAKFLVLALGAEYERSFGKESMTAKLSFKF